jgi:nicotinamide-nucleotide amidase
MRDAIVIDDRLIAQAAELLEACRVRGITLATAESCTGGLVAATLTALPGASDVVERGFVTYSNAAKSEMLGVPVWLIERHGAVSEDVARAMAGGALTHSRASLVIAVTGIAGPDGGSAEKPVGLVHFAAGMREQAISHERMLFGDLGRSEIRRLAVEGAFRLVASLLR